MNSQEDGAGRNRRVTPATVINSRAAKALVAPIQDRLGAWQAEAIKLEVMADRIESAGRADPGLVQAARALRDEVKAQALSFEASLAGESEGVRLHTRVTDTQKVLAFLALRIERLIADLT